MDWWQKVQYPQPIFLAESDDEEKSDESVYVNTEEMTGNEGCEQNGPTIQ